MPLRVVLFSRNTPSLNRTPVCPSAEGRRNTGDVLRMGTDHANILVHLSP
jgi:hypothetical protein